MKKKSIITLFIIIISIIILLLSYVYFVNRTIKIDKNSSFNKVYKKGYDIDNIEIDILHTLGHTVAKVTDKDDITNILNVILNEDLKYSSGRNMSVGNSYIFNIKNIKTNTNVKISIGLYSLTINSKNFYKTSTNLLETLKSTYEKYYIKNY